MAFFHYLKNRYTILLWFLLFQSPLWSNRIQLDATWKYLKSQNYICASETLDAAFENIQNINNDTLLSDALSLKGTLLASLGKVDTAINWHKQALKYRIKLFQYSSLKVANTLHNLGNCYIGLSNVKEAEDALLQSIEIRKKLLPRDHVDIASSQNSLGSLFIMQGNFQKALPYLKKAEIIFEKNLNHYTSEYIQVLINQSNIYYHQNFPEWSLYLLHTALSLNKGLNKGLLNEREAYLLGLIGKAYGLSGNSELALNAYYQAIRYYDQIPPEAINYRHKIELFNNLGNELLIRQDYGLALEYFNKAFRLLSQIPYPFDEDKIACLNNIAICYQNQRKYLRARNNLEEAQGALENSGKNDHPILGDIYFNYGIILMDQSFSEEGEYWLRKKALSFYKNHNSSPEKIFKVYVQLASLYVKTNNQEQLKKTIASIQKLKNQQHTLKGTRYLWRIQLLQAKFGIIQKTNEKALDHINSAWKLVADKNDFLLEQLETKLLKAQVLEEQNLDPEEIFQLYKEAYNLQKRVIQKIKGPKSSLYFRERLRDIYDGLVRNALKINKKPNLKNELAIQFSEDYQSPFLKNWLFNNYRKEQNYLQASLRNELANLEITRLKMEQLEQFASTPSNSYLKILNAIEEKKNQLFSLSERNSNSVFEEGISLQEIQKTLLPGQAIIKFHFGKKMVTIMDDKIRYYLESLNKKMILP